MGGREFISGGVKVLPGFAADGAISGRAGMQPLPRTAFISRLCHFID